MYAYMTDAFLCKICWNGALMHVALGPAVHTHISFIIRKKDFYLPVKKEDSCNLHVYVCVFV
jgi:hypothetical protein